VPDNDRHLNPSHGFQKFLQDLGLINELGLNIARAEGDLLLQFRLMFLAGLQSGRSSDAKAETGGFCL
jgi:hypothetical protein